MSKELSKRQKDIMDLMLSGLQDKEIAAILDLKPPTIRNTNQNIYRKLKVENRTQAVIKYLSMKKGNIT